MPAAVLDCTFPSSRQPGLILSVSSNWKDEPKVSHSPVIKNIHVVARRKKKGNIRYFDYPYILEETSKNLSKNRIRFLIQVELLTHSLSSLDLGNPNVKIVLFHFLRKKKNQRNKLDFLKSLWQHSFLFKSSSRWAVCGTANSHLNMDLKSALDIFDMWMGAKMPSVFRDIWLI